VKKRLKVVNQSDCLKCLACEAACSMAFYKEFDPSKASIYVTEKNNEPKTVVCVQCGKCARTCEYDAITQNKRGVYVINKKLCTGCGECAKVCPFGVLVHEEEKPTKCIACGICARECPMDVLAVVD